MKTNLEEFSLFALFFIQPLSRTPWDILRVAASFCIVQYTNRLLYINC